MASGMFTGTARDMIVSLAVILVPVGIVWGVLSYAPDAPEVDTVNPTPVMSRAASVAPFHLLEAKNLPDGWRATSARFASQGQRFVGDQTATGDWWEIGYLSPDDIHFALNQRSGDPGAWLAALTRSGIEDGTSTLAGQEWTRYVSPDDRTRSLVRDDGDSTIVLVADASYEALEAFAGTLG